MLASQLAVAVTVVAPYLPAQPIAAELVTLELAMICSRLVLWAPSLLLDLPNGPFLFVASSPGLEPLRALSDLSSLELRAPRPHFPIP